MSNKKTAAKAGVIGAVVGALAGVFLISPKSAKENRAAVKAGALKARQEAEKKLKSAYADLQTQSRKLRAKLATLEGKAKDEAQVAQKKIQKLMDQTKDLLAALRDGDDDVAEQVKTVLSEVGKLKDTLADKAKNQNREKLTAGWRKKKKKSVRGLSKRDYERLGQSIEEVVSTSYLSKRQLFQTNFLRGIFFGLGTTIGVSIIIAVMLTVFNVFSDLPVVGDFFKSAEDKVNQATSE